MQRETQHCQWQFWCLKVQELGKIIKIFPEMRNIFLEQAAFYVVNKSRLFPTNKVWYWALIDVLLGDTFIEIFFSLLAPITGTVLHCYRFISLLIANHIIWRTAASWNRENAATVQFRTDFTGTTWSEVEKDILWNGGRPLSLALYYRSSY